VPTAQKAGATIAVNPTGGTGSKLLITVVVKTADEDGAETTSTTSINGAAYTTLKDVIDKLNTIEGITAYALHAPHSLTTDSNDFIALSTTDIRTDGLPTECLYRDVSEAIGGVKYAWMRIGNPEPRDSGRIRLLGINGTNTGVTTGTLKLFRDDYSQAAAEELLSYALVAAETAYVSDNIEQALVYRGPLLVQVASSDLTASDIKVRHAQPEW
jgi:hypothetical protein